MDNTVLDIPEFLERVQDDKELLMELLEIFVEDFKQKRPLLEGVISASDFEHIKSIAHSIKGASGNVSAKKVREVIIEIEDMAEESDTSKGTQLLQRLDEEFEKLLTNIEEVKANFSN